MIQFAKVTKQYGPRVLYRDISFQINPGEKVGLVGPNGAGKSTIFKLLIGEESPDSGQVNKPTQLRMSYFSQDIEDMRGKSALEEVISSVPTFERLKSKMQELEAKLSEEMPEDQMTKTLEEYGNLQGDFERLGGYALESTCQDILTGLGIGPQDYHRPTESFSGGWKMRIALAKVLAQNPEVLLMDEPTNHLDLESIEWLEEWLRNFEGSILMTSHDRDFMNRLVKRIIEVQNQTIVSYSGNYDFYEREREIRRAQLEAQSQRQEDMLAKEEEFIARFKARASHAAQVQSRVKKIEKIERVEIPPDEKEVKIQWPAIPRGGDEVIKFEKLTRAFTRPGTLASDPVSTKVVLKNIQARVVRGDRVAVVGVNGAGKSTLLKIAAGELEPSEGRSHLGPSIQVGYFSQNSLDVLNPDWTVLEEMESRLPQANVGTLRNLLGAFKFSNEAVEKKIKILSGGEKSRLVLATLVAQPFNFLILDEPTNHLDIQTREILLEALKSYPGTLMIVSHDRHFLRQITTRVFYIQNSGMEVFDGTWDEFHEHRSRLNL